MNNHLKTKKVYMKISGVTPVCFSPTGTTQKVLAAIAAGLGLKQTAICDLTLPDAAAKAAFGGGDTLTVFGTPVYGGRVPQEALTRLAECQCSGGPAVVVVVYGNRAYEDALRELADVVAARGFVPVAAGAFIGEHSFSTKDAPIAVGRPDAADLDKAKAFGAAIRKKIDGLSSVSAMATLSVPGNVPYRQRSAMPVTAPVSREDVCLRCGQCASVCPTGAITVTDKVMTRAEACIHCCACVKICPTGARVVEHPKLLEVAQRLATNCAARREPETYC